MIYAATITTANTVTAANPQKTVVKVAKGLVYKFELEFPPGSLGNLFVAVFDGLYQVWPSSTGVWFSSDKNTIAFEDTYLKAIPPFEFNVYTYNTGDSWPHTCHVRIGLVTNDEFIARYLPAKSYEFMIRALQDMEAQQREAQGGVLESPFPWLSGGG
uniref:Uncharacterized protein n=1 Tax=viral metagenome TaxID=1070528 RepID=A0A6H1ZZL2_9ZZZZ